jgi:hypothetical protein
MKLIIQFSPPSLHFIPFWSKYPPQHLVLKQYSMYSQLTSVAGIYMQYIMVPRIIAKYSYNHKIAFLFPERQLFRKISMDGF